MSDRVGERVVLYVRSGCHLCEVARDVVAPVAAEAGAGVSEIDIDTAPDAAELVERYGELVPVVVVDGVQQGYWRIDAGRVRRALAAGRA
ncbi:glutaredoxin family protein [Actinotalea sp. JY-7885]|uniref:glutaredoxin family protein n=1 Tax=Actinotalea sp. JY-7885 TaxID=2758576 RepID=UPI00165E546C|nr:glutaredoxin family protein [Actinotalea sp. JY-7885]